MGIASEKAETIIIKNEIASRIEAEGKRLPNNLVPMEKVIEYFNINLNIPESDRHRALFDAVNTAIVLTECFKLLEKQGIYDISHL